MSEKGRWLDAKYYEWELLFGDNKTHLIFAEWMYAQALADARAAVEKINLDDDYPINIITKAIAAIEKLEVK